MIGDWYRDPWGWPEIDWAATRDQTLLLERLNGSGAHGVATIDVPKENYSIRPAVVLDPLDRLVYQCLVDVHSSKLIGDLDPHVFGWRLRTKDPEPGIYSPNNKQWEFYRGHLGLLAAWFECGLKTDVVACFASLNVEAVIEGVYERAGSGVVSRRLEGMLKSWSRVADRSGLPQRSLPSAVLANMLLRGIDDRLLFHSVGVEIFGHRMRSFARWMDDIWIFGHDPGELRKAQIEIQSGLRTMGLHINTGKTKLLEGDDLVSEALNIEHSAVDSALDQEPKDVEPLAQLIERVMTEKEEASRTSVRFATDRMRAHAQFQYVAPFMEQAHRFPHAADALARLFRDAGRAAQMEDWYVDYLAGPWGTIDWAAAQFATMFSSAHSAGRDVRAALTERLSRGNAPLPMVAVAAQRLAAWSPADARVVIGDAANRSTDALRRRVLALAGLHAGCRRTEVRRWLREHEENAATLALLENASFTALPLKSDFEG